MLAALAGPPPSKRPRAPPDEPVPSAYTRSRGARASLQSATPTAAASKASTTEVQLPARDKRAEAAALNAPDPGTIPGGVGLTIHAASEPRWRCTPAALNLLELCRAAAGPGAGAQAAAAAARHAPEPPADAGRAGERRERR